MSRLVLILALIPALTLPLMLAQPAIADGFGDNSKALAKAIDAFMARFDANRDGKVTPTEFADRTQFARLDRDRDGSITRGDFYRVEPPREAMMDDPEQGPKNGGKGSFPPGGDALRFSLMMQVDKKTWARIRPYVQVWDLFWGDVPGIPTKVRGHYTTGTPPTAQEVASCRAVLLDLRKADNKTALAKTRAVKAALDAVNKKRGEKSGWKSRELVAYYTTRQLADVAELSRLADVVMIGDETWGPETLAGGGTVKPAPYLGVVELGGKMAAICLGTTPKHKYDADTVEKMIRKVVKGHKLTHVGFVCGDDRLHVLLDVLGRVR